MLHSKLHCISIGIVAENKARDQERVKIYPLEILPFAKEAIDDISTDHFAIGVDKHTQQYTVKLTVDNTVDASWLSLDTNVITSPDLIKGEQVLLYQYANEDKYYYTSMGRDDRLRRLETRTLRFSNIKDLTEEVEALTQENSYEITVSTHDKYIHITTNKYDGEPFAYNIKLDTAQGNFILEDDVGNNLFLDSENTFIRGINADQTTWQLDKKNILIQAPDSIVIEAVNTITINCTDLLVNASNSIVSKTNTMNYTASSSYVLKTASCSIDSPNSSFSGNVEIKGNTTIKGNTKAEVITCKKLVSADPISAPNV